MPNSASVTAVPLHSWRGSNQQLHTTGWGRVGLPSDGTDRTDRTAEPQPPPSHILLTPVELHGPATTAAPATATAAVVVAAQAPAPGLSVPARGLTAPARPLRRSLDDRMLRPRPAPEPTRSPRPSRRSLEEQHWSQKHGAEQGSRESGAEQGSWEHGAEQGSWEHGANQEQGSWERGDGEEQEWRPLLRHDSGQDVGQERPRRSPRHALLHQHVRHTSLQRLPLPSVSRPRARPVSLQETCLHLQPIPLEMSPLYHSSPQKDRASARQLSPQEEQPPLYHTLQTNQPPLYQSLQQGQPPLDQPSPQESQFQLGPLNPASPPQSVIESSPLTSAGLDSSALYRLSVLPQSPSDPPGRPQRVSLQEVRLEPVPAASRRPQRVSLQETGAAGAGRDGPRKDRKCGVFGHHPAVHGRSWALGLAELTEK